MARDLDKMYASNQEWHDANTALWTVRIRNDSGIPNALDKLLEDQKETGITRNAFIREAIEEKLVKDGYLPGGLSYEMRMEAESYGLKMIELAAMAIEDRRRYEQQHPEEAGLNEIQAVQEWIACNRPNIK